MNEKLKAFLLECHKHWTIRRALLTTISKLLDAEIEDAIDADPRFAAVVRGLLNGDDFDIIEDQAQLNCAVEAYITNDK